MTTLAPESGLHSLHQAAAARWACARCRAAGHRAPRTRRQALPLAVAAVRGADGGSPAEAAELLVEVAAGADNRGNPYDDAGLTAALVTALGGLRPRSPEVPAPPRAAPRGPALKSRCRPAAPVDDSLKGRRSCGACAGAARVCSCPVMRACPQPSRDRASQGAYPPRAACPRTRARARERTRRLPDRQARPYTRAAAQLLARVVAQLDRHLALEAVRASAQHVVGCAALCALERLAAALPHPSALGRRRAPGSLCPGHAPARSEKPCPSLVTLMDSCARSWGLLLGAAANRGLPAPAQAGNFLRHARDAGMQRAC